MNNLHRDRKKKGGEDQLAILIELMDGKRHTATEMAFKFETSIKK